MCSTTTILFKPSSVANGCINSLPSLFTAKTSYPFLSLPSKPINFLHLTCSPSSWVSSRKRNSSSTVIAFVARTSDWARQEEEGEVVEEMFNWENQQTDGSSAEDGDTVVEESEESYIEPPEEAKIFVGNLPYDMDSEKLAQLFDQAGVVEVSEVIYNRETDQSRGFGFLTMSTVEEAEKAVNMFNGYDVNGRLLTVNKAAPRGSRSELPPRMFEPSFKIYVGNLPWQVDDARLEQIFSVHGKVVDARVLYDRESGRSRGFGFITMSTQTEVDDAIAALDGQNLDGRAIRVNVAEQRPRRGSF